MDEIKCTIPAPVLKNTITVLESYGTRLEGAIDWKSLLGRTTTK